jgi:hypothetical protein
VTIGTELTTVIVIVIAIVFTSIGTFIVIIIKFKLSGIDLEVVVR